MKYLSDYMSDKQSKAFKKAGSFFAFSKEQFEKEQVKGVKYVNMGCGLICRKDTAKKLKKELDDIYKESIKQDLAENGKINIIKRELSNHESYYTYDLTDTIECLEDYPITKKEIKDVFNNEKKNHLND